MQNESDFYRSLPPEIKEKLIFALLDTYYRKFFVFFNDVTTQNFGDPVFIRKILQSMDCEIFIANSTIVESGKPFPSLFFNFKNGVRVVDPFLGLNITDYPEGSFFGDYQLLMNINARFDYVASPDASPDGTISNITADNTWCMTIKNGIFSEICDQFPDFRDFLIRRGLKRRAFLQHV